LRDALQFARPEAAAGLKRSAVAQGAVWHVHQQKKLGPVSVA
jgi:hypothetical protein